MLQKPALSNRIALGLVDFFNPPTIVIGMHRSGTTLISRLLDFFGFYVGDDLEENHESLFFQGLNDKLLEKGGGNWFDIEGVLSAMKNPDWEKGEVAWLKDQILSNLFHVFFRQKRFQSRFIQKSEFRWGWKDPRSSLTLPLWLKIFPRARVIHIFRHGLDVAISLHRRELRGLTHMRDSPLYTGLDFCLKLWERYTVQCFRYRALGPGRYFEIKFEDLLSAPEAHLKRLVRFLGIRPAKDKLGAAVQMVDQNATGRFNENEFGDFSRRARESCPLLRELQYG